MVVVSELRSARAVRVAVVFVRVSRPMTFHVTVECDGGVVPFQVRMADEPSDAKNLALDLALAILKQWPVHFPGSGNVIRIQVSP